MFEPVLSLLVELWDIVQPELDCPLSANVIHADKGAETNWQQTFGKIVKRAGLEPWPKTFKALRATRELELATVLPLHVVAAWRGNTPKVALGHYLLTTSDHHEQASTLDIVVELDETKAARNPARSTSEWAGTPGSQKKEPFKIHENSEGFSTETFRHQGFWGRIVVNPYRVSTPGRIRTSNLRLRKPTIYPVDLRGRAS